MFRVTLLLVSVAICQATAGPKPESVEPSTRLFGFPWINPSIVVSAGLVSTVTTTVQVPLYIVRTSTVWQQGGVSTVYLPGAPPNPNTVYQTSYVFSTVTEWSGAGASTSYVTSYFPVTITAAAAQQVVAVETVTQVVAPSVFGITRTVIKQCSNTVTRTRTRTRTRTQQYQYNTAHLTAGHGSTTSATDTQTIPPHYLRF